MATPLEAQSLVSPAEMALKSTTEAIRSMGSIASREFASHATEEGFVGESTAPIVVPAKASSEDSLDYKQAPASNAGVVFSPADGMAAQALNPEPPPFPTPPPPPVSSPQQEPTLPPPPLTPAQPEVSGPTPPTSKFSFPKWAKIATASTLAISIVAFGTYLLGNQQAQNKASSQTSVSDVSAQSALTSGSNVGSLHFNKAVTIDQGASLTATGTTTLRNQVNSTVAFSVQDAQGSGILTVNTVDKTINIGGPDNNVTLQIAGAVTITGGLTVDSLSAGNATIGNQGITLNTLVVCSVNGCIPNTKDAVSLQGENASFYTNATNITSGTISNARLSTNVALLDASQTFSGSNTFRNTSTTAFQIQNADASNTILRVDTSSGTNKIYITGQGGNGDGIRLVTTAPNHDGVDISMDTGVGTGWIIDQNGLNPDLRFSTNTFDGVNNFSQKITFQGGTGNLGVGSTNPTRKLQVMGDALFQNASNSTTAFQIQNAAGTSNLFVADTTNGIVGVGATILGTQLNINTVNANATVGITATGTGQFSILNFNDENGVDGQIRYDHNGDLLQFGTNGNSPSFQMDLNGAALFKNANNSTTSFQIQNTSSAPLFVVDSTNSRIAIGPSAVPANGVLTIGTNTTAATGGIYFGTNVNLYQGSGSTLRTDNNLYALGPNGVSTFSLSGNEAFRNFLLSSDTQPAIKINGDGKISWGAGGASAVDTNLYRGQAGQLYTDGSLRILGGALQLSNVSSQISFDTESSSNNAILASKVGSDSNQRFVIKTDGTINWGPGTGATDTSLGRSAAGVLKTDNNLLVQTASNSTTAFQVQNAAGNNYVQVDTSGATLSLGNTSIASTIQIGNTTGAVAQTINIGNNAIASSATTITIGSTIGTSPMTLQAGSSGIVHKSTSTTAFVLQKADGTGTILTADTSTGAITISGTLTASNGLTISSGSLVTSSTGIYVSSLPGSPVDGQEVYYKADAANGIIWHLRYNAGSASTYKWEYLGGADMISVITTEQSPGSTSAWVNLTTNGPSVTIPVSGEYEVSFSVDFRAATSSRMIVGIAVGDTTPPLPWADTSNQLGAGLAVNRYALGPYRATYSAGDVVKLRYDSSDSTNTFYSNRHLSIRPVRVN